MPIDPMNPAALLHAAHFDEATEIVDMLETSENPDEMSEMIERLAQGGDMTHAVIFRMWCRMRGFPDELGLQIATKEASFSSLILPPGV